MNPSIYENKSVNSDELEDSDSDEDILDLKKADPVWGDKNKVRLIHNLRSRLKKCIKRKRQPKRLLQYLGCSYKQYIAWMQFQLYDNMTLANYGQFWHIDHCKPCKLYNFSQYDQTKACFNWINLRPYTKKKNLQKSSKYTIFDTLMQELKAYHFLLILNRIKQNK